MTHFRSVSIQGQPTVDSILSKDKTAQIHEELDKLFSKALDENSDLLRTTLGMRFIGNDRDYNQMIPVYAHEGNYELYLFRQNPNLWGQEKGDIVVGACRRDGKELDNEERLALDRYVLKFSVERDGRVVSLDTSTGWNGPLGWRDFDGSKIYATGCKSKELENPNSSVGYLEWDYTH